ncbi:MAG: hypothetical protein IJN29_06600 [Akkermansia sp.]|nr:hypothetical protein [Akkermansia sp.]
MIHTLAHNPEAIVAAIFGAFALVLFGTPVLYSLLTALAFMLSGVGAGVSWWRRLTAPAVSLLGGFLFIGLLMLWQCFDGAGGADSPVWVEVAKGATAVFWLLLPLPVCRILLKFNWWRSLLATLLVPLMLAVGVVVCLFGLGDWLAPPEEPDMPDGEVMVAEGELESM